MTLAARWSGAEPARYPDAAIQVLDPAFAGLRIGNAAVERLATGFRWCEGPVWFGSQSIYSVYVNAQGGAGG